MRAKSLAARQSGRIDASDGRLIPPARTSSVTWFSRSRARPVAAAPMRHQACGTSRTVAGSAPAVYRVVANVRALATSAAPEQLPKIPPVVLARAGVVPGLPLEYESLA